MLKRFLIVIRNPLSCSNPSPLLIWTEPINIESPRFQCQLKLESVTFFSVSRFLLCTEMCVGGPHTKMRRTRHYHMWAWSSKWAAFPNAKKKRQFKVLASWLFLWHIGGRLQFLRWLRTPTLRFSVSHFTKTILTIRFKNSSKASASAWRSHRLAWISDGASCWSWGARWRPFLLPGFGE